MTHVYCTQCGKETGVGTRFCPHCGAEQPDAQQSTAQQSTAQGQDEASARVFTAPSGPQLNTANWPIVQGLPIELWLVIAAFAIPGAWVLIKALSLIFPAFKYLGADYFGFRLGLALVLILVLVALIGAALLVIAWRLYQRDPVGRGLAFATAGTLVLSVALSSDHTAAETWAMLFSLAGIAILALVPRVKEIYMPRPGDAPTSIVVGRTLIAIFSAYAILIAAIYFLMATVDGKYVIAGLVAGAIAVGASAMSKRLNTADRQARQYISIGAALAVLALLIFGQSSAGLLLPIGFIAATVICLWVPNDARRFFGDDPLNFSMGPPSA